MDLSGELKNFGETSHQKQWPCSGDRCHIMIPVKEVFGMMIYDDYDSFPPFSHQNLNGT